LILTPTGGCEAGGGCDGGGGRGRHLGNVILIIIILNI